MGGKGGGAWKVAYADFVTAMMAFFLVMWIVAQDKKIKEGVSHYFIDPMGYNPIGLSSDAGKSGALTDSTDSGTVPNSESVAAGRGRRESGDADRAAYATKMVSRWLRNDADSFDYWHNQAEKVRSEVSKRKPVTASVDSIDEDASLELSAKMKSEVTQNIPPAVDGLYRDLIQDSLERVKWDDVAEDILSHD